MDAGYFEKISKLFNRNCEEFEGEPCAVGWISKETQRRRFEVLLSGLPKDYPYSILDVGSGQGALLEYIQKAKLPYRHTGIDISPVMVEWSKSRFPGHNFSCRNIVEVTEVYDFVIASGIFCHRHEDSLGVAKMLMTAMYKQARLGVAFNALSAAAPDYLIDTKHFQYFHPKELVALAMEITPHIRLRHDYLPNDMTLHLFKLSQ